MIRSWSNLRQKRKLRVTFNILMYIFLTLIGIIALQSVLFFLIVIFSLLKSILNCFLCNLANFIFKTFEFILLIFLLKIAELITITFFLLLLTRIILFILQSQILNNINIKFANHFFIKFILNPRLSTYLNQI